MNPEKLHADHPRLARFAFYGRLVAVLGVPCLLLALAAGLWGGQSWAPLRLALEVGGVFALICMLPYLFASPPVIGPGVSGLKRSLAWTVISLAALVLLVIGTLILLDDIVQQAV